MYSRNKPWNQTPARAVIDDVALADAVENAAARSVCVRLLVALAADASAWVAKTAVNRGAAPYLVMHHEAHGYDAPLDRKVAQVDIDTLLTLGLLQRKDAPISTYLGSEVEQSFGLSARGLAVLTSASRFKAAFEAIVRTRAEQRERHQQAARVSAEIALPFKELQQDALALGLGFIREAASIDRASAETLPPALAPLRDLLEQAWHLAPTLHALAPRFNELAELRGPAADVAAGFAPPDTGLAEA
ncbi:MAG: hypothetical protein H3C62_01255 [Gemmatimonadaceae bacterium]|nr:hypothetical protein [Gemmatimonadaceae bacterium]